jgi:hypothetical protein
MKYIIAILLVSLIGCLGHQGYIRHRVEKTNPDGSKMVAETEAKVPPNANNPTPIVIGPDGVTADLSGTHKPDAVAKQTTWPVQVPLHPANSACGVCLRRCGVLYSPHYTR